MQLDPPGQLPPHTPGSHAGGATQPQKARYGGVGLTAGVHTSVPEQGGSQVVQRPVPPVMQKHADPAASQ
jgi:hypothetical protein